MSLQIRHRLELEDPSFLLPQSNRARCDIRLDEISPSDVVQVDAATVVAATLRFRRLAVVDVPARRPPPHCGGRSDALLWRRRGGSRTAARRGVLFLLLLLFSPVPVTQSGVQAQLRQPQRVLVRPLFIREVVLRRRGRPV